MAGAPVVPLALGVERVQLHTAPGALVPHADRPVVSAHLPGGERAHPLAPGPLRRRQRARQLGPARRSFRAGGWRSPAETWRYLWRGDARRQTGVTNRRRPRLLSLA